MHALKVAERHYSYPPPPPPPPPQKKKLNKKSFFFPTDQYSGHFTRIKGERLLGIQGLPRSGKQSGLWEQGWVKRLLWSAVVSVG